MWPGISRIDLTIDPKISELAYHGGQLAVIYAYNGMIESEDGEQVKQYCPVATGRMAGKGEINNAEPRQGLPQTGKAVFIDHYLFDELWNMGSRKIPTEFQIQAEITEQPPEKMEDLEQEEEEEKVDLT